MHFTLKTLPNSFHLHFQERFFLTMNEYNKFCYLKIFKNKQALYLITWAKMRILFREHPLDVLVVLPQTFCRIKRKPAPHHTIL